MLICKFATKQSNKYCYKLGFPTLYSIENWNTPIKVKTECDKNKRRTGKAQMSISSANNNKKLLNGF